MLYDWLNLEDLGIDRNEYKSVIEKFPVVKDLKEMINRYNNILDGEFNSNDNESLEIFKKIFDLVKKIK